MFNFYLIIIISIISILNYFYAIPKQKEQIYKSAYAEGYQARIDYERGK